MLWLQNFGWCMLGAAYLIVAVAVFIAFGKLSLMVGDFLSDRVGDTAAVLGAMTIIALPIAATVATVLTIVRP